MKQSTFSDTQKALILKQSAKGCRLRIAAPRLGLRPECPLSKSGGRMYIIDS